MTRQFILAALCPAALALAAEPTQVVTIQGSAAAYDARRDDTAARIVVGRDELARFGDANVSEVLKRQPGITVDANGAIAMRGLGKGYTQILLNGERVANGFAVDSIAPELIERIEINRTPTADQRAEAIAGTINIVLRKAGRRSQRSASLQASHGRGEPSAALKLQVGEPGERLSWQLGGSLVSNAQRLSWRSVTTGADAAGEADLLRHGRLDMDWRARLVSVNPTASLKLANGDTLSLQAFLTRGIVDKDARGFSNTVFGPSDSVVRDTQLTEERNTQSRAALEWAHRFTPERDLSLKLTGSEFRRSADFHQRGWDSAGVVNLVDHTASGFRERSLVNSGRYAQRLNDRHALVAGWEAERTTRWEDRRQRLRREGRDSAPYFDFDATIERLALYAQDEWAVSEALALYLGLRAERLALRTTGNDFAEVRRTDDVVSPVAQLLWKLGGGKGDQVRVGLSRTYKAPPARSLIPRPYTSTNNGPLEPDERGNPHLKPELAFGLDAAFERHWAKGAMFSIGGYLRRIDGVTRDDVVLENGRWVRYPANGGRGRVRGLEFDTRFKLADLMTDAPKIDLRFNLTRNWSDVDDVPGPDNRVAEQLRFSSTLGADYQASNQWSVGASFSHKRGGAVRTTLRRHVITGNRSELDAYALYAIAPGFKLRLSVANALADEELTGSRYRDANGERQFIDTRTMPVTWRVALEWSR